MKARFIKSFKICLVFVICLLTINIASAQRYRDRNQDNDPNPSYDNPDSLANMSFADRLVKGSNFWLGFQPAYIDISPILGYRITTNLQAGIGATYIYYNGLEPYYDVNGNIQYYRIEGTMYGGRMYAEYDFAKNALGRNSRFFAHAEYEDMNVSNPTPITGLPERTWYYSQYVGIGYRSAIGKKAFFNMSILFNINYDQFATINPNGSQIIERIGVTF
jgi:hypothetical protein